MRTLNGLALMSVAVCGLAVVAVACLDGRGTEDDTGRDISNDELAMMVLALEDFGAEFSDFQPDEGNGTLTADERAQNSIDPKNEALRLERFGWVSRYEESYLNPKAGEERVEVFFLHSGVDAFDTAKGAASYFEESSATLEDDVGKTKSGMTLEKIQRFSADLADEAEGFHSRFLVESEGGCSFYFWITGLALRHGRLLGSVGIYGYEESWPEEKITGLARQLDERMSAVLAGDVATEATLRPVW